MAIRHVSDILQHLRRTVLIQDGAERTDAQLLAEYLSQRDESALAALVRRHGPMVWGVCLRVLRNAHDAEDAFQATFLVFVRKAATIASRELVANWLYGVARQIARKARATTSRRHERERQVNTMPEPAVVERDCWSDLQPLLEEELSHLPDRYRSVILLCDLEGKTRREAALLLGVPHGTVGGWLARARTALATRLTQRGVVLSGGALATVLARNVASAGVPGSIVVSTIRAATLLGSGQATTGVISARAAALTEGVLTTMLMTKLRFAAGVFVLLAFFGICGKSWFSWSEALAQAPLPSAAQDEKPEKVPHVAPRRIGNDDYEEFLGVIVGILDESRFGVQHEEKRLGRLLNGEAPIRGIALGDIAVNKDTRFLIDGKEGKFADLEKSMRVVVELKPATNLALRVQASWPKVRGEIAFVDARKITLMTRKTHILPTENQVHLRMDVAFLDKAGAKVFIDGKEGKLADLKAGMSVVCYLSADTEDILRVEARKGNEK